MKNPSEYQSLEDAWIDLCDAEPATEGQKLIWFSGAAFGAALARGTGEQRAALNRDLLRVGREAIAKAAR